MLVCLTGGNSIRKGCNPAYRGKHVIPHLWKNSGVTRKIIPQVIPDRYLHHV